MKIMINVLLIFILWVSWVQASEIIFAVDLSEPMNQSQDGNRSALEQAVSQIEARTVDSATTAGLVGYVDKSLLEIPLGELDATGLARLATAEGDSSLIVGLVAATSLVGEGDDTNVVVYTSKGDESLKQLQMQIETLAIGNLSVELNLFSQGQYLAPLLVGFGEKISPLSTQKIDKVRSFLATQLGVHVAALEDDSDLALDFGIGQIEALDFGIGQIEAYELLVQLCDELKIPFPTGHVPTRLGDIVDYIERVIDPKLEGSVALATASGMESAPVLGSRAIKGSDGLYVQTIYYGTNRKPTGEQDPEGFFGGARGEDGPVVYGICEVTIPANHKHGVTESPFLGLEMFADPQKHIRIRGIHPMAGDTFFTALYDSVHHPKQLDDWTNDLVVFIHGFNVTFAEGAKRTAQIAFDFGFTGSPVMFSWPSDGKLLGYPSDREDATWSIAHIEQFLQDIRLKAGPKKMHLVAHSMGNQGLIGALNLIAMKSGSDEALFDSITMAAPDFDAQLFEQQIASSVVKLAKRWTIYTSDNDAALNISTKINSAERLGLPVTPILGIDVIDATGIEVTPWSVPEFHSYYATKQTVINDIVAAIKGVAPTMRELRPMSKRNIPYWQLKSSMIE